MALRRARYGARIAAGKKATGRRAEQSSQHFDGGIHPGEINQQPRVRHGARRESFANEARDHLSVACFPRRMAPRLDDYLDTQNRRTITSDARRSGNG
jgi:hypothetical protein